jgi:cytochrome c oxidase assembly factor CtaG
MFLYAVAQTLGAISNPAGGSWFIGTICSAAGRGAQDFVFDPWVTIPLFGSGLIYLGGVSVLWCRVGFGRGILIWWAAAFAAGWMALVTALVSPLHHIAEQLFTVHMIEHEIVMAVAAPLLVLSRPAAGFLWALPKDLRHAIARAARSAVARSAWTWLTKPIHATIIQAVAIWAWHLPTLFDAAVVNIPLHRFQHACFLVTGILFWWAMLRRSNRGAACGHLFLTMMHTGILGALIALAPHVLYPVQTAQAPLWGLTSLEDQQLAGLLMWIPAGVIYAGAALAFAALWIRRAGATAWKTDHAIPQA